ncbi:MAG: response regulator [Candidatus Dadabacteria bacterium]|nr:response regulator [Candidatus Dadabacteria bacterium]NIX14833.1 response regulator [Candidatus Dadabacteria bacterium]NIY21459.1 response regulator [Candidatus Dadabacteria bacterium]
MISVESETGKGTKFKIYLPALQAGLKTTEDEQKSQKEDKVLSGKGRVLVMYDESGIREIVRAMLCRIGYLVVCTEDSEQAVSEYSRALDNDESYDVVILDLTIPGGRGGHKTLEDLVKVDPNVKAIVSSGYSTDPVMAEYEKYGFFGCVAKPFKASELSEVLSKVING